MNRVSLAAVCIGLLVAAGPSRGQSRVVSEAARALGGKDRLLALRTLVIEGAGENGNLGQNHRPDSELPRYSVSDFRRTIDFEHHLWKQEQVRTPMFATGNIAAVRQVIGSSGDTGYVAAPDGSIARATEVQDRDRRIQFYEYPLTLVRLALRDGKVTRLRIVGGNDVVDIATTRGEKFTLYVNRRTHLPSKVTTLSDQPNLGDVVVETTFGGYVESGGLKLPTLLKTRVDRFPTAQINVSRNTVDGPTGDLALPPAARALLTPPPLNVTAEEAAPGVWLLAGGTHNSVLLEFADHMTLVEAPLSDVRTFAVLEKARQLRPDKPVTELINSHHHFDHAGGLRAAVSQGLKVYTHALDKPFYVELAARRHTVWPDALATKPKPLRIQTVAERTVLRDTMRTAEIYHVAGSAHAASLLMVYLPAEKLLIEADAYNPPPATNAPPTLVFPFAANLVDNVQKYGLKVERVVPLHGRIIPWADVVQRAGK